MTTLLAGACAVLLTLAAPALHAAAITLKTNDNSGTTSWTGSTN